MNTPSWFAPPALWSAFAAACDGNDTDLAKGTHLRLLPSAAIGLPLAPLTVWSLPAEPLERITVVWTDAAGTVMPDGDLSRAGRELYGWIRPDPDYAGRLLGVELVLPAGERGEITLLDRIGRRRIVRRSADRCLVAAPEFLCVQVRGRSVATLRGWGLSYSRALECAIVAREFATLSAPFDGDAPWYAEGEGRDRAWARVAEGAPLRYGPPDRPDGPFDSLTPADEQARLQPHRVDVEAEFAALVGDDRTPPAQVRAEHVVPAAVGPDGRRRPWQKVDTQVLTNLLMKAQDPGIARLLGLMARLPMFPDPVDAQGRPAATVLLVAGLFACPRLEDRGLAAPDDHERTLLDRTLARRPRLERTSTQARRHDLAPRLLLTAALAAPVADRLDAPAIALGEASWLTPAEGPATAFRQRFVLADTPLATLVAVGRREADGWHSRHLQAGEPPRAVPRLLGRLGAQAALANGPQALVEETSIDAQAAPLDYRFALADLFGVYGAASTIAVPLPARPAVPPPTVRHTLQLHAAEALPADGTASPGQVRFVVTVPSLQTLTAGALPLAHAVVQFDGQTQQQAAPQDGGEQGFDFPLPALAPTASDRREATAHFDDVQGRQGAPERVAVDFADPRPPVVPRTAPGLVWTSLPGPGETVECRLQLRAAPNARYRVYQTDAAALQIVPTVGERLKSRAQVALEGPHAGAAANDRTRFRLLTDAPLQATPQGDVHYALVLPRSLQTVQFVRFVPLSERGTEAPFDACPLLAVAVPRDQPPPALNLQVEIDDATGAVSIGIVAQGLNRTLLEADEPSLFEQPPRADANAPAYRLRRSAGALRWNGDAFVHTVPDPVADGGAPPYVRLTYWAQVQLPAERRLPPGVNQAPLPDGGLAPVHAAAREDAPGAFSAVSAPAVAMRVPAEVPALQAAQCTATHAPSADGTQRVLTLSIEGAPSTHPKAVGRFSVAVHLREDDGDYVLREAALPLDAGRAQFISQHAPAVARIDLALVLRDPLGRTSLPLLIDAAAG